jgi:hypothetical protein
VSAPHLVQLLLPVFDNQGRRFEEQHFADVRREMTERFGGVTAYLRSPASGLWVRGDGSVDRDDVVMVEVMVDALDHAWWRTYRSTLERVFQQQTIVVRSFAIELL